MFKSHKITNFKPKRNRSCVCFVNVNFMVNWPIINTFGICHETYIIKLLISVLNRPSNLLVLNQYYTRTWPIRIRPIHVSANPFEFKTVKDLYACFLFCIANDKTKRGGSDCIVSRVVLCREVVFCLAPWIYDSMAEIVCRVRVCVCRMLCLVKLVRVSRGFVV